MFSHFPTTGKDLIRISAFKAAYKPGGPYPAGTATVLCNHIHSGLPRILKILYRVRAGLKC